MRSGVSERDFAVLSLREVLRELAAAQASVADALVELARDGADTASLGIARSSLDGAIRRFGEGVLVLGRASEALARACEELERERENG